VPRRYSVSVRLWQALVSRVSPFGELGLSRLYAKDLSQPLTEARAGVAVDIGLATEAELDQVAQTMAAGTGLPDPRIVRERLRRGALCFVARMDGIVVHSNWLVFDRMQYWSDDDAGDVLAPGEVYCTDGNTIASSRGRAIHTEVLYRMLVFLQQAGYRRAYTIAEHANQDSWKTHVRLRWELSGLALHFRPRNSGKTRLAAVVWGLAGKQARTKPPADPPIRSEPHLIDEPVKRAASE
jgi:hypothetical protein